ncbi:MAG: Asp-tRNA(Asn)/Glu-tRNA(Gln) amidotransferase subunit GatC [Patescibacteria group bacterium]
MALTRTDIERLAELSRLALTEEEMVRMEQTIDPILNYVGRLSEVNTDVVPETEEADEVRALRVDEAIPATQETHDGIVANFPDKKDGLLRAPAVFEKPKS